MSQPVLSDKEFIKLFNQIGPVALSKLMEISERSIYARRRRIEQRTGINVIPANPKYIEKNEHPHRLDVRVKNGVVIVGSDAHYWPGEPSLAHRAFVSFIKKMKPVAVIQNGDVMDFPRVSRHPQIGWENLPEVHEEVEFAQDRMHEIATAAGRARKIWTLGNHDFRYETRLATVAPEYAKIHGVHLSDHFPLWEPCWSVWINDDVVVKHRFKGGIHATHNNTMWAGKTTVTGHLHSLKVTPFTDYNGTRYGVDTGCLANTDGKQFVDYTEDSPKNWRSGFVILSFVDGKIVHPEVVMVSEHKEGHVEYRGQLWKI